MDVLLVMGEVETVGLLFEKEGTLGDVADGEDPLMSPPRGSYELGSSPKNVGGP